MSFSYDITLADAISQVRFEVGDKVDAQHLLEDEEITALLAIIAAVPATPTRTEVLITAAELADALAVEFAQDVNTKNLSLSESEGDRSKQFKECARRLRNRAGITQSESGTIAQAVKIFVGGLSISKKRALSEDSDAVQPEFRRGQDDHPGTVDSDAFPFDHHH